ncbi:hypothetical protein [Streptomyces antibioticus]|uniref:Uncharacterized protein n=1 Tax=Streptomyces antibioticus TaxID=1890 RepID=A0AAE6YDF7_STRAT|nr:hypothetical protein [Streptomyces antibioticus]OOQ48651.1 hypothetical protein AFM16_26925 [Streptomyces antibioticus]QIT46787.1 hypothetical protein HCX60_27395 [Streptomyces antibioticus]
MGTKTVDETGAEPGTEATEVTEAAEATEVANDDRAVDMTKTDAVDETAVEDGEDTDADDTDAAVGDVPAGPTGVGQGAGAVVSAALGLVSLTGSWIGTVAGARQTLVGQLKSSSGSASVAEQIQAVYGDAWQTTALWGGLFALAALVTGVVVLARPAFGSPARPQAPWIKSVSWAGIALGVIGLLLAVLKYTDALLGLPSAG